MIILVFLTPQCLCGSCLLVLAEAFRTVSSNDRFLDMVLTLRRRLQVVHPLGMLVTLDLRSISDQSSKLQFLFTKRYCEELVLSFSQCFSMALI